MCEKKKGRELKGELKSIYFLIMLEATCGTKKKWVSVLKKGVVESGEFFF